jgi:superfamily II DNA or RNA helicase
MSVQLRPYQEAAIQGLRDAFAADYHSPLLVLPTGGGKTVCFSYLTSRLQAAGKRVVILVHRDELVDQVSETLSRFDVAHGYIAAGRMYDRRHRVHVASVQTLARRMDRVAVPDYVICDEAHHCIGASTWGRVVAEWRSKLPSLRLIGVTATPERLSGEGLGEVFDEMVLGPTTRELVDLGALSEYRLFAPAQQLDLSGVKSRMGDFVKGEVAARVDKPAIIGSAVGEYRKRMDGQPAVAFCVSIEHAEHVAEQFRAQGYRAAKLDGTMERSLRKGIVSDFGRGAINVLTSVDVISEGFDVPGIVGAILLRPTQSLGLYLQQVGRALRTAPGKPHAVILDHVGNSSRHGLPDDPREWSLLGRGERKGKGAKDPDDVAIRQCPTCFAVSPAAAAKCRECGAVFPLKPRTIEEVAGTLSEVEVARVKREAKREQAAAQTLEDLIRLGTARGYKNAVGWAKHLFAARGGRRA